MIDATDGSTGPRTVRLDGAPPRRRLVQARLEAVFAQCVDVRDGEVADYIPALAEASPDRFGVCVVGVDGRASAVGDADHAVLDPERVQAVRVRAGVRRASAPTRPRDQLGRQRHRACRSTR